MRKTWEGPGKKIPSSFLSLVLGFWGFFLLLLFCFLVGQLVGWVCLFICFLILQKRAVRHGVAARED